MKTFLRAVLLVLALSPVAHAQIAAAPAPFLKSQWLDANGDPLASGCLYTYAAGGTTPKTTYTTSAGSGGASNTNPVTLDSAGRALVWLGSGNYRFDLYEAGAASCASPGSLVWSIDNIPGFGPSGWGSAIGGSGSSTQCAYFTASTTIAGDAGCTYNSTTDSLTLLGALSVGTTLSVTGNVAINTNKFNITASSGNTTIAGTLGVTGATTLSSTLAVAGAGSFGTAGTVTLANATSGTIAITPTTGALGTRTVTIPAADFTVSGLRTFECGTTSTCANTAASTGNWAFIGSVALGSASPSVVTVSGFSPAFTSTATYTCTAVPEGATAAIAAAGVAVTKTSASSVTFTGPNTVTTVIDYRCEGH
jgi:hypothetical protein